MKRLSCLLVVLIVLAFCFNLSNGFTHTRQTDSSKLVSSSLTYTLDDTLEPDEIPDFVSDVPQQQLSDMTPLRVDAPVKFKELPFKFVGEETVESDLAVKIHPPIFKLTESILPEFSSPYALVQYTAEKSKPQLHNHNRRPQNRVNRELDNESISAPAPSYSGKESFKVAANAKANKKSEDETISESKSKATPNIKPAEPPDQLFMAIQTALKANTTRAITTVNNTPGDVLLAALPYGVDAKIWQPDPNAAATRSSRNKKVQQGNYIYSIGALCWNYSCNSKTLLRGDGKNVFARVGAGYQLRPGSFLALLAMSNIMPNYELKVGGGIYTIANLIASEKRGVSRGSNMSMILVGLSFYGTPSDSWKNDLGEVWNIERMVIEELNRPIDQGTSDVTDWLLGLTAAVNLYEAEGVSLRGAVALAKKQIGVYQEWVLSVQNENYLWHPKFFLYRGVGADNFDTLYASGHILRWLVLSLSDERLQDVRIKRSISSLIAAINRIPTNQNAGTLSDRQLEALAVSLQTISIYKQRVYGIDEEQD
ncbi:MAG: hypothetical protein LBP59_04475 [Planctomycetaceae bacterium]|jgi:hypothetical protein|nr:hypothetical protein [Planctomycetaceae bacterium]